MRAASRDPRGDFSFDVQPVLLAVFCPRLFQRAGLVLGSDSESAQRQYQGTHLTWGSAARPVVPHLRQVMIGVWMLRPVRIRCSIPSSSSRKLMSVGIDTPWCHFDCNRTTISGNQVRCASPDGIFGNLLTNCPFSTFGLRHCSRAASSELDIACESKPRNYSRDIAGARFSGWH